MKNKKTAVGNGVSSQKPHPSSSSSSLTRKPRWDSDNNPPSEQQQQQQQQQHPPSNNINNSNPKLPSNSDHPSSSSGPSVNPTSSSPANPLAPPLTIPGHGAGPPPPPPAYGFHMLERRTIVLADGSVRSYFALPPDPPVDTIAADKFFPYGAPKPDLGAGLGYDRHFPHPHAPLPVGCRFSPENFRDLPFHRQDYRSYLGMDEPSSSLKRKYGEEDEYAWHRQHVVQYGSANAKPSLDRLDYMGRAAGSPLHRDHLDDGRLLRNQKLGGSPSNDDQWGRGDRDAPPPALDVDPQALKRAFLRFSKFINESVSRKKNYLEDGKHGRLSCLACGRASKTFIDMHGLIMHTYGLQNADSRVDHLGLHKALCVLMGWNYGKAPDDSKAYQSLPVKDAAANKEDLILWPPNVIIHNTITGRRKDGRMEGIGNKEMDKKLKELGFIGGKSKAIYGKEGHQGLTMVKFANTEAGLKEAERLANFFEKDNHGRWGWERLETSRISEDDNNPALWKMDEKTGEKKRVFYGYIATASDLDKIDFDTRKKAAIRSRREFDSSDY